MADYEAVKKIVGSVASPSDLGTGTPSSSNYLRGDGAWTTPSGTGDVVGPASATDNAITRFDTTTGKLIQNSAVTIDDNGTITHVAGAAGYPPLIVPAGTLMTTPSDGAIEMDANALYACTDAGNRGYIPVRHVIRADGTRTFANVGTSQVIFSSPTNGRLTLETGTYLVEGLLNIGSMSATSGNLLLNLLGAGTATMASILYHVVGVDGATATAATQTGSTAVTNSTPASALTAGVGTAATLQIRGSFEITAAGTIIPSITLVTAAAAVLAVGSYMTFERIGDTSLVSVGQWD